LLLHVIALWSAVHVALAAWSCVSLWAADCMPLYTSHACHIAATSTSWICQTHAFWHTPPSACRSSDAEYAWKKMGKLLCLHDQRLPESVVCCIASTLPRLTFCTDGLRIDCKKWKVEYAIREDFKYFGWKWTEGGDSPTPSPPR